MRIPTAWRPTRSLADEYSSRGNSIGFLRLVLATSVLVAHSWPLGLGESNLGNAWTRGQVDFGGLGVFGFFVLSGFLITGSGMRFSLPRYAWHRFLRIFPGFWVCILLTAIVIAPLVALYENDSLAGFWNHPQGPLQYLTQNFFTGMRQYGISGLLMDTPYGRMMGVSVFDGSLWSLAYELCCYIMVGTLAWTGVLRHAPRLVLLMTGGLYLILVADFVRQLPKLNTYPYPRGVLGPLPLLGPLLIETVLVLFFLFLVGASAHLYRDRIPMTRWWGIGAAVVFVGSATIGGFYVIGLPAYAYLLLWAACKLPRRLQGVGRARDYSYGIYIYAFPVQQVLALVGGARWGVGVYMLMSFAGAVLLAVPSWHLVERPAMSLKDYTPRWPGRREQAPEPATPEPATPEPAAEPPPEQQADKQPAGDRTPALTTTARPEGDH